MAKQYPIYKVNLGRISAAVFEGQYGYSVKLQRRVYNQQTKESRYEGMYIGSVEDAFKVGEIAIKVANWLLDHPSVKNATPGTDSAEQQPQNDEIPF